WFGVACEEWVCLNGGWPSANENGSMMCYCPDGLEGERCERVIKCDHGKLVNETCQCYNGYAGIFCESSCYHGNDTAEEYHCECREGLTGSLCSEPIWCMHGLISTNGCLCRCGFSGVMCEDVVEEMPDPNPDCISMLDPPAGPIRASNSLPTMRTFYMMISPLLIPLVYLVFILLIVLLFCMALHVLHSCHLDRESCGKKLKKVSSQHTASTSYTNLIEKLIHRNV
ncbi:hypothetical protein PENTCL1PPCAC_20746, partial [Pristionchus entomophagus]